MPLQLEALDRWRAPAVADVTMPACSPGVAPLPTRQPLTRCCCWCRVQAAFNTAASSGAAMLYLAGNYGIGSELTFTPGTTIMAEPGARFVSGG